MSSKGFVESRAIDEIVGRTIKLCGDEFAGDVFNCNAHDYGAARCGGKETEGDEGDRCHDGGLERVTLLVVEKSNHCLLCYEVMGECACRAALNKLGMSRLWSEAAA